MQVASRLSINTIATDFPYYKLAKLLFFETAAAVVMIVDLKCNIARNRVEWGEYA